MFNRFLARDRRARPASDRKNTCLMSTTLPELALRRRRFRGTPLKANWSDLDYALDTLKCLAYYPSPTN
jgi:hypothetical protein